MSDTKADAKKTKADVENTKTDVETKNPEASEAPAVPAAPAAPAAPKVAEGQETRPQLVMHAQYIKDFSFENPNASSVLTGNTGQPNVEVGVNVSAKKMEENRYEVLLKLTANAKAEDTQLFMIELAYGGLVTAQGVTADQTNALIMIEGPRLLFPFARAVIAQTTREGGFLPLNIQPIDFVAVYRANIESQRAEAQEAADTQTKQ